LEGLNNKRQEVRGEVWRKCEKQIHSKIHFKLKITLSLLFFLLLLAKCLKKIKGNDAKATPKTFSLCLQLFGVLKFAGEILLLYLKPSIWKMESDSQLPC